MTLGPREIAAGAAAALSPGSRYRDPDEEDDDYFGEEDDEEEEQAKEDPELEAAHIRCRDLIDAMLNNAREAILSRYVPEEKKSKVLTAGEVQERDVNTVKSAGGHGSLGEADTVDTSASWQADTSLASSVADSTAGAASEEAILVEDEANIVVPEAELPRQAPPEAETVHTAQAEAEADISLDTSTATSTTDSTAAADDSTASEKRDEDDEGDSEAEDEEDEDDEGEEDEDEGSGAENLHPPSAPWNGNTGAADVSID